MTDDLVKDIEDGNVPMRDVKLRTKVLSEKHGFDKNEAGRFGASVHSVKVPTCCSISLKDVNICWKSKNICYLDSSWLPKTESFVRRT
jgi:hypothetical protein